jgi:hypothetical protein
MHRFGNGSFDPKTLMIVETAFDEAWITLRTNGHDSIRPKELARCILHLAMGTIQLCSRSQTRMAKDSALRRPALAGLVPGLKISKSYAVKSA